MKPHIAVIGLAASTAQAQHPAPTPEQAIIAAVLVAEAGGEGWQGLRAVHETICNRAKLKGWSKTRVVMQKWQYSCLNRVKPDTLIKRAQQHDAWEAALKVATSKAGDIVKGATHYDNVKRNGLPAWAQNARMVAKVKNHQFYILN